MGKSSIRGPLTIAATVATSATVLLAAPQGTLTRVNLGPGGVQAIQDANEANCSSDGRFVVFATHAGNLVPNDTNSLDDVFLVDRQAGTLVRISLAAGGVQITHPSNMPRISRTGNVIAYSSFGDPAPGGLPGGPNLYAYDVASDSTVLVSIGMGGAAPDQPTVYSSVSGDGRFVAFASNASNLVPGDTNGLSDVFVRDLLNATTERVSVSDSGSQGGSQSHDAAISGDGRFVAFSSNSPFVFGDTNGTSDVYVRDRSAGTTTWISRGAGGAQPNGLSNAHAISGDGAWIAFGSAASNIVTPDTNGKRDEFLYEQATGQMLRLDVGLAGAQPNGDMSVKSLSNDGRFVGFWSGATNIAPINVRGWFDAFVYDRLSGSTEIVSRSLAGAYGDGSSSSVAISDDGRIAVFISKATNLIGGDTNNRTDVFVRERVAAAPESYCTAQTNSLGCIPAVSSSGTPSASSLGPFNIDAGNVLNGKAGLLFYGFASSQIPFYGGWLCVASPLSRTLAQDSGGLSGPPDNCTGQYSFDFNDLIRNGTDPRLVGGTIVYAQYWSRDPTSVSTTNFTDAVAFTIQP